MLAPHLFILFCKSRMLSADCRCFTFDHRANGYVRGEGTGAVFLMKLEDAKSRKIPVAGILAGTATNHNGRAASVTAPNGPAQQDVIRSALSFAELTPEKISYIEAHGTGTGLGDPIEVGALSAVFGPNRAIANPLVIGAVKTNIGHLEGSAGIAGLIKLILVLNNLQVPANLNFEKLNPHIDVTDFPVVFPTEPVALRVASDDGLIAGGVSGFGFGGSNAHAVVVMPTQEDGVEWKQLCTESTSDSQTTLFNGRKVGFLFTGQGSQYNGMGRELYIGGPPEVKMIFDTADRIIKDGGYFGEDRGLFDVMWPKDAGSTEIDDTRHAQVGVFVVEVAVCKYLELNGLVAEAVLGHSLGEYAGAVYAGLMSFEDGVKLVAARAKIMADTPSRGGVMYAVRASPADYEVALSTVSRQNSKANMEVSIAAINGPKSITISGAKDTTESILTAMGKPPGRGSKQITVSHAFHSPLVQSTLPEVEAAIDTLSIAFQDPSPNVSFCSTVMGKVVDGDALKDKGYWIRHIIQPVLFADGVNAMISNCGCTVVIEIGPRPQLLQLTRPCIPTSVTAEISLIPSLQPSNATKTELEMLDQVVIGGRTASKLVWSHTEPFLWDDSASHPILGTHHAFWDQEREEISSVLEASGSVKGIKFLQDHVVQGMAIVPGAAVLDMAVTAISTHLNENFHKRPLHEQSKWVKVDKLVLTRAMLCGDKLSVQIKVDKSADSRVCIISSDSEGDGYFENARLESYQIIDKPQEALLKYPVAAEALDRLRDEFSDAEPVDIDLQYRTLKSVGLEYKPNFQTIKEARVKGVECLAKIKSYMPENLDKPRSFEAGFRAHPAVVDGAFQCMTLVLYNAGQRNAMLPVEIDDAIVGRIVPGIDYWCRCKLIRKSPRTAVMAIEIYNFIGRLCLKIGRITLRAVDALQIEFPKDLYWNVGWKDLVKTELYSPDATQETLPQTTVDFMVDDTAEFYQTGDYLLVGSSAFTHTAETLNIEFARGTANLVVTDAPKNDIEADIAVRDRDWKAIVFTSCLNPDKSEAEALGDALMIAKVYGRAYNGFPKDSRLPVLIMPAFSSRHGGLQSFCRCAFVELDNMLSRKPPVVYVDVPEELVPTDFAQFKSVIKRIVETACEHPEEGELRLSVAPEVAPDQVSRLVRHQPALGPRGYPSLAIAEPKVSNGQVDLKQVFSIKSCMRPEKLPSEGIDAVCVRVMAFEVTPDAQRELRNPTVDERWADIKSRFVGIVAATVGTANKSFRAGDRVQGEASNAWQSWLIVEPGTLKPYVESVRFDEMVRVTSSDQVADVMTESPSTSIWFTWPSPLRNGMPSNDDAYVITGGLGGLGLTTARFLIEEGARKLFLLSRTGAPTASVRESAAYQYLTDSVADVVCVKCDVGKEDQIMSMLSDIGSKSVVRGIFHCAGILKDMQLSNQSRVHIDDVYLGKAAGALYLDKALAALDMNKTLEHFVTYSSVTAMIGNYSQVNYGAANGVLDMLCERRRKQNLPGLSIQFGPWIEQGMASELVGLLEKVGMRGISNDVGLRILYATMSASLHVPESTPAVIGVQSFNWRRFLRRYTSTPTLFADLDPSLLASGDGGAVIDVRSLSRADLINLLADIAQGVSGSSIRPTGQTPLIEMGFDSLGAVEFRNNILDVTGIRLTQTLAFENPTLDAVADFIVEQSSATGAEPAGVKTRKKDLEAQLNLTVDQWLMNAFAPAAERYTLYVERFAEFFPDLESLVNVVDVDEALVSILKIDHEDDNARLANAWHELQDKVLGQAGTSGVVITAGPVRTTGAKVPHPLEDLKMLLGELDQYDVSNVRPQTLEKDAKRVFLTGATGFVGRNQVYSILTSKTHPDLTLYCVVRARDPAHALSRIKEACEEAEVWRDEFAQRIVPIPGDFTKNKLGLTDQAFADLCEQIDIVYHTGGDVNLLCNYSKLRDTNTLNVRCILELCTTYKMKPLHFTSTLGQYPDLFGFFTNEFEDRYLHEDTGPRLDEMEKYFPPARQGYPWSKWAAEQVIRAARERLKLPVCIYRLPNTYCAYRTGYTNRTDYATATMISTIQEGVFPRSSAFAVLTPVDIIADMVVEGGLLSTRQHWVYNLIDTGLVYQKDMETWAEEVGIAYKGVDIDEFLDVIRNRGPTTPVYRFVPLMQYWRKYWFDPKERVEPWPIRNQNIFDDLPHMKWPPLRDVFKASFLFSAKHGFFAANSKSVVIDADRIIEAAEKATGLDDLGDADYIVEPMMALQNSLVNTGVPISFVGKLSIYQTSKQYLMNMMFLHQREQECPEIKNEKIIAPLVILGLNRSGTTFLQNLICADTRNRGVLYMEQVCPYGPKGDFKRYNIPCDADLSDDPRRPYAQEILDMQLGLTDEWMLIHAQDALKPEEEFIIQEHAGRSYSISVAFGSDKYTEWLFDNDYAELRKSYTFHKKFLQHLQYQRRGDRFVLKLPFHLWTLDTLLEHYPDARIVMTHRDPMQTMASWCSLVTNARQRTLFHIDPAAIGQSELKAMASMITSGLKFRNEHPEFESQFFDVDYERLIKDPATVVDEIYQHFNIERSDKAQKEITEFLQDDSRKKRKRHHYTLEQAGLDENKVREAFKVYYDSKYLKS